jgi:hypothetical protein
MINKSAISKGYIWGGLISLCLLNILFVSAAGADFDSNSETWGEQQLKSMTEDRPQMLECVTQNDPAWSWVASHFKTKSAQLIHWDASLPKKSFDYDSDCDQSSHGPLVIRIRRFNRDGQPLSCERIWSCIMFELMNAANITRFHQVHKQALAGLSRKAYIRENTEIEYETVKKMAALYRTVWLKGANVCTSEDPYNYWFINTLPTYEEWLSGFKDLNRYPWNSYGKFFDESISPYVAKHHPAKKKLLEKKADDK